MCRGPRDVMEVLIKFGPVPIFVLEICIKKKSAQIAAKKLS